MALGDADLVERAVAAVVGEQQRSDAGRVGLERQHQHVVHELNVLGVVGRDAGGRLDGRVLRLAEPLRLLDAGFDFADAGEVLVEFLAVAGVEPLLHGPGVVQHEVEDRLVLLLPAFEVRRRSPGLPSPNSRSNTSRGFDSAAFGVVAELQEMLNW